MNPYYEPKELGLELISFDEPNMSYEYNTLCFWADKEGRVYTASDSGCSCPTPFEYANDRPTVEEVIQTLERVGSLEQAERIFDAWNAGYIPGHAMLNADVRRGLSEWIKQHLKP